MHKLFTVLLSLALSVLMICGPDHALRANSQAPWRSAISDRGMLQDARDGQLDHFTLLDAALLANGIDDPDLQQQLRDRLHEEIELLQAETSDVVDLQARAELVLRRMHQRILRGTYQADCTQLARALREGDYNCVSATLVYTLLCRAIALDPQAVATPTHVFSRLTVADRTFDIQTTCANWFELSPAQKRAHTPSTPANSVAQQPRTLSDVQLIAKIYYNRGVRHLRAGRFAAAEEDFQQAWQLDPQDDAARENLLATWNNWALDHAGGRNFAEAAALIRRGLALDPQYGPLKANDLHVHQQWAVTLCEQERFQEAIELLDAGRQRQPGQPLFVNGPQAVFRLWAAAQAVGGDVAGAVCTCHAALRHAAGHGERIEREQWLAELVEQLESDGHLAAARELRKQTTLSRPQAATYTELPDHLTAGEL